MSRRLPVPEFEGLYCASNDGTIYSEQTGKPLKQCVDGRGYMSIGLISPSSGKRHHINVHRIIAQTFLPNDDNLPVVHHIDGNKFNNAVTNLQWTTHTHNLQCRRPFTRGKCIVYPGDKQNEQWKHVTKDIEISSHGRIRKNTKLWVSNATDHPYEYIKIQGKNIPVHRLVAENFIGPRPSPYHIANHIDNNKKNNNVNNLEYATLTENQLHAAKFRKLSTSSSSSSCNYQGK